MSITGLPDPYCDVTYADGINLSAGWIAASTVEKEAALQWGKVYMDKMYSCSWDSDETPDNVKTANAMLGEEYVLDASKFFSVQNTATSVKREKVVAGSVSSETEYTDVATAPDQFPYITALVGDVCYIPSADVGVAAVIRR